MPGETWRTKAFDAVNSANSATNRTQSQPVSSELTEFTALAETKNAGRIRSPSLNSQEFRSRPEFLRIQQPAQSGVPGTKMSVNKPETAVKLNEFCRF